MMVWLVRRRSVGVDEGVSLHLGYCVGVWVRVGVIGGVAVLVVVG